MNWGSSMIFRKHRNSNDSKQISNVLFLAAVLVFPGACAVMQGQASFLPAGRTVDWTHVGIPGGIPDANWPVCQTIPPSGGADDSTTIQNAINSCPAGSVVALTAGTYTLHRSSKVCVGKSDDGGYGVHEAGLCLTDKSIVLRGAGPNQTVLDYGDGANGISLGETYLSSSRVSLIPITSTASQGATQITLSSASGISANSYIVVTQTNPTDTDGNPLTTIDGYTGACTYCMNNQTNNLMEQVEQVTAVSGNTITLARPLYYNYNTSPAVFVLPMIQSVGLEDLRFNATASSGTGEVYGNIRIEACADCWVHNVESDYAVDQENFLLFQTYQNEISNNYLYQGYTHTSGESYGIWVEFQNSEDLVANNIIRLQRHATPQSGGSGNVYAYNYETGDYMGEYTSSLPETEGHGAHPYMNLWEGNVTENFEWDFAHGSSSHNTMFRNYIYMSDTNPSTNSPMTSGLIALNVAYYSNYNNVVGNVFGPSTGSCVASTYETDAPASKVGSVIWQLGYYDDGSGSSPNQTLSSKVGNTLLRGGNWDCVTKAAVWSSNAPSSGGTFPSSYLASTTLPNSLVFSAAPSYFAATGAVWPPINPSATTVANPIPAQICYNEGAANSLGGGFNPAACYGGTATTTAPQPPTNLTGTVQQ
jgi:hypothetical protein